MDPLLRRELSPAWSRDVCVRQAGFQICAYFLSGVSSIQYKKALTQDVAVGARNLFLYILTRFACPAEEVIVLYVAETVAIRIEISVEAFED
jgi:hypothetical protein